MATGRAYVGISGWRYPGWRGDFYPRGLPQRQELTYASERLTSIEINGTFYSLQRPGSFARWAVETPPGFRFAVKGGRFVTHLKRLRDVEAPLANFFASGVLALGDRLGPFLWQLPETLAFDEGVVRDFLALLPRTTGELVELARKHDERLADRKDLEARVAGDAEVRHAIEPRSPTWVGEAPRAVLAEGGIAMVLADTAGRWPRIDADSAPGFRYVRLHGDRELYASGYTDAALDTWAGQLRGWLEAGQDVYAYFDNDAKGRAPHDALALLARLGPGRQEA